MFVYVEWKFDPNEQNKINILKISEKKDPTIKYEISNNKYVLGCAKLNDFNYDQVHFTRCKVGTESKTNKLELLVTESFNTNDGCFELCAKMCSNKSTMTSLIKYMYYINIFTDENNNQIKSEIYGFYYSNSNHMAKRLRNLKCETYMDKHDNNFTLWLGNVDIN